jgi:hypothetical protein
MIYALITIFVLIVAVGYLWLSRLAQVNRMRLAGALPSNAPTVDLIERKGSRWEFRTVKLSGFWKAIIVIVVLFTVPAILGVIIQPSYVANEKRHEQAERAAAAVPMVCGVPNPIPKWIQYHAPAHDAFWSSAPVVEIPSPQTLNCRVAVNTDSAVRGTFDEQCRSGFGFWFDVDPKGHSGVCTAIRRKSKTHARILPLYLRGDTG